MSKTKSFPCTTGKMSEAIEIAYQQPARRFVGRGTAWRGRCAEAHEGSVKGVKGGSYNLGPARPSDACAGVTNTAIDSQPPQRLCFFMSPLQVRTRASRSVVTSSQVLPDRNFSMAVRRAAAPWSAVMLSAGSPSSNSSLSRRCRCKLTLHANGGLRP